MRAAALVAVALASAGCDTGFPASPSGEGGGTDSSTYAVCPSGLQPTFGSIVTRMLATASCGTNVVDGCHSHTGAPMTGNLLDFTLDAGDVYVELLGPDAGGRTAVNLAGDAGPVFRVVPGDAGASMLYIKLTLPGNDPRYGRGMPWTAPGSVCPAAIDAVKSWIDQGAA